MSNYRETPVVFVVDDSQIVRDNIVKRLKKEGYCVKSFESGERVLEELESEHPDLLLLDLNMPRLSGGETIHEMQKRGLSVPVVILTAHQELIDMSNVTYKAVMSLVTKTLELEDVVSVAREAIAAQRS